MAERRPPERKPPEHRPPEPADRARLTSRAAVLAVVLCAVALSLAYPVREYIAQHRQIAQLQAERQATLSQIQRLEREQKRLTSPAYVEQLARDKLHMCLPSQTCYVVISPPRHHVARATAAVGVPWYERLWHSVQQADRASPG